LHKKDNQNKSEENFQKNFLNFLNNLFVVKMRAGGNAAVAAPPPKRL
jgi:hypothetical protein